MRRHSVEIAGNPHVAVAFCLPQTPTEPVRGLQVEGVAEILEDESSIQKASDLLVGPIFPEERAEALMADQSRPHRFYRLKLDAFVLFDALNFPNDPRQTWKPSS